MTEFGFTSADGLHIACARWEGRGPVLGVIQIAHGMCEHIGRYIDTIEALVSAGLIVYGNDHRGHGRTRPPPQISEISARAALTCWWKTWFI